MDGYCFTTRNTEEEVVVVFTVTGDLVLHRETVAKGLTFGGGFLHEGT